MLESDQIAKLAERHALDTEFADAEGGPILTARPEDLQTFAVRHLTDGLVFGETMRLVAAN